MIVKTGSSYVVKSEDGKRTLSKKYKSKKAAVQRLREIEYFKAHKGG